MRKLSAFLFASLLLLSFSSSGFAVIVFGNGDIGSDQFFEIVLDENSTPMKGRILYSDYPANKFIGGEITAVTVDLSSKVSFSGTFTTEDGEHTFSAVVEDLGTGDNVDSFAISDSFGYSKSGVVILGGIDIQQ